VVFNRTISADFWILLVLKSKNSNIKVVKSEEEVEGEARVMTTCEQPTHHIKRHTYIWQTDMGKMTGGRARTGQHPPGAFCLS